MLIYNISINKEIFLHMNITTLLYSALKILYNTIIKINNIITNIK